MSEKEDELEQQTIELHFEEAMNNVRKQLSEKIQPTGYCYNCEEPVEYVDQLFCDMDCRDDYEKRKRAEKHRLY